MQWHACRDAEKRGRREIKSQSLAEMMRQLFAQWSLRPFSTRPFVASASTVLRWREVWIQITSWRPASHLNRTSGEVAPHADRLRSRQCALFFRESSFEQGRAKEFTALETQLFLSTRAALGEQVVNLSQRLKGDACKAMRRRFFFKCFMGLLGTVSKRFHVSRHIEMQVLLRRLHQFQGLSFSESSAVFKAVVQEIGQPSLNGNGHVGTSEKRLSQLGIVMNRTTNRATMKVRFNADE